jgi:Family of unknown function (DUF6498)
MGPALWQNRAMGEDDDPRVRAIRDELWQSTRPTRLIRSPVLGGALLRAVPPLIGVFVAGWSAQDWIAFWFLETVLIGLVNVLRILTTRGLPDPSESPRESSHVGTALFFVVHYGLFVAIQAGIISSFAEGFDPWQFIARIDVQQVAATALALELLDFFRCSILHGERDLYSPVGQMFRPYPRIFVQQLTVILGGWITVASPVLGEAGVARGVFVLLLAIRIGTDLVSPAFDRGLRTRRPATGP